MSSIELRGVSKRYRDTVALQPIDLTINEGEFFCLLGPSGCGKTTTLNLIGGFVELSSGEIVIEGQRADRIPPYKRNVNTVFQNYALFPHLSVRDNVGFGLKMAQDEPQGRGAADRGRAQARRARGSGRPLPGAALRWPAAARRRRPRARQPPGGAAAR